MIFKSGVFLPILMYINYDNFFFGGGGAKWAGLCIWKSEFSNAQRHALIVYNRILELENATPPPWLIKYLRVFSLMHRNILGYVNENKTFWLSI